MVVVEEDERAATVGEDPMELEASLLRGVMCRVGDESPEERTATRRSKHSTTLHSCILTHQSDRQITMILATQN